MAKLKEAKRSVVMAGYAMMRWRRKAIKGAGYGKYQEMALECVPIAGAKLVAEGEVWDYQVSQVMEILFSAAAVLNNPNVSYYERMSAAHSIGRAHGLAADINEQAGYCPPTFEQLSEFGPGGGR